MKKYKPTLRNYISAGGRYAGFCLGAYLAGYDPGFNLLPSGSDTDEEITQKGAQVKSTKNMIIQVDWTFQTGPRKGQKADGRWLYFQDGAVVKLDLKRAGVDVEVLGRYSSNGDVAACVVGFGKGRVGLVGPHPEADESWCEYSFLPFLCGSFVSGLMVGVLWSLLIGVACRSGV